MRRRYYAELHPKGRVVTIHDLLRMAEEGDATAIAAVSRQATSIGRGLRLITAALAPEVILITGDITTSWPRFGPIIQKGLEDTMLAGRPPRLEITSDGELSRLRGAAAVVYSAIPATAVPTLTKKSAVAKYAQVTKPNSR